MDHGISNGNHYCDGDDDNGDDENGDDDDDDVHNDCHGDDGDVKGNLLVFINTLFQCAVSPN